MANSSLMTVKIILKPVIPATLRQIKVGASSKFRARDFGPLGSVRSAITKLNKKGNNFAVTNIFGNGESYIVQRN